MHIFVNMASEVDKCLDEYEKQVISDGRNQYAFQWIESGAARLIRTASKAFTSHWGHFQTYLKTHFGLHNTLMTLSS